MAFREIDKQLLDLCTKDIIDINEINAIISEGANVNAFDEEFEQELYASILDYFIDKEHPNPSNLYEVTELYIDNNLILNQKADDSDYYLLRDFRFLPPDKKCVDVFRMLLERCIFSFEDNCSMIRDFVLDLHMHEYYFYEETQYTKEDCARYYLALIYWACAYNVRRYPEKCEKELLKFDWFNKENTQVVLVRNGCSTSVVVEDKETHKRAVIDGWSMTH